MILQSHRRAALSVVAAAAGDAPAAAVAPRAGGTENVSLDCGWGRLLFADTFADAGALAEAMRAESPGRRDIAFYVRDPHVLLAAAPHELFLDPSHAFRLTLADLEAPDADPEDPASLLIDRQALHAHNLRFAHPMTEQPINLTAPLPPDMARTLDALRLHRLPEAPTKRRR